MSVIITNNESIQTAQTPPNSKAKAHPIVQPNFRVNPYTDSDFFRIAPDGTN